MTLQDVEPEIRSDEEILEALRSAIRTYDQVKMSRGHFTYTVNNGVVVLTGNLKSALMRRVLIDRISMLDGVEAVDDSGLYDDETLAMQIGEVLPPRVRTRLTHGIVALTGHLPTGESPEELLAKVAEIPGIQSVTEEFID